MARVTTLERVGSSLRATRFLLAGGSAGGLGTWAEAALLAAARVRRGAQFSLSAMDPDPPLAHSMPGCRFGVGGVRGGEKGMGVLVYRR